MTTAAVSTRRRKCSVTASSARRLEPPVAAIFTGGPTLHLTAFSRRYPGVAYIKCVDNVCTGNNTCQYANTGTLCAECGPQVKPFFYRDTAQKCQECDDDNTQTVIMAVIALVVLLIVIRIAVKVGLDSLAYLKKDLKGMVSTVTFVQIISLLGNFQFSWPQEIKDFLALFSIFKLNINVAHTECLSELFRTPVPKYTPPRSPAERASWRPASRPLPAARAPCRYLISLAMPVVFAIALGLVVLWAHLHARLVKANSGALRRCFPRTFLHAAQAQLKLIISDLHLPLPVADAASVHVP